MFQIWVYRWVCLCTFLTMAAEKYQKNATKGLSALWTPVFPIWVCLTGDIHGGGFEKRSAKACGDAFLTPRQTQPKVGAFGVYFSHSFCRVEGGACYPLSVGRQPPLPCLRERSGGEPLGETIHFPAELGSQPRGRHSDGRAAPWQTAT